MNVLQYLEKAAEVNPDKPALIMNQDGREVAIAFAQLRDKTASFAAAMKAKGLKPGDRAIIMVPMSVELYIVMLGIIRMGAVAIFVDPWIGHKQIAAFSAFAEPSAFIGIGKSHVLRLFNRKLLSIPLTVTTGSSFLGLPAKYNLDKLLASYPTDNAIYDADDKDPALITFTSGSSGVPKGANRTHGFLSAQHRALKGEFPYQTDDVDMPMFPVFALNNLATGLTSVIPDMDFRKVSEVNAETIYGQMSRHGVTTCTASPPFFDRLAEFAKESDSPLELRHILTGGAPVSTEQLKRWRQIFSSTGIDVVYGSTEAEPVAHMSLEERLQADDAGLAGYCVGTPASCLLAKVIGIVKGTVESGGPIADLEMPRGEIGELVVSGNHVCRDYFNNPEAVKENKIIEADRTLWHRMGDTGYFDDEGRFWLTGRVHTTIWRNRGAVHPQVAEKLVKQSNPALKQVAVFGVSDQELGEKVVVLIQLDEDNMFLTKQLQGEVMQVCAAGSVPVDAVVTQTESFPMDPRHNSKIDYDKLRKQTVELI